MDEIYQLNGNPMTDTADRAVAWVSEQLKKDVEFQRIPLRGVDGRYRLLEYAKILEEAAGKIPDAIQREETAVESPIIRRKWAMPNSLTFSIQPIKEIIERWTKGREVIVDPFARNSKIGTITNDIDQSCDTMYHMDATDFLKTLGDSSADAVLYDPPYSTRQVAECYKKMGRTVTWRDTTNEYWRSQKEEIARIVKPGGICITCAWNSGGIGRKLGFEIEEILLVAHGGWHNDTIVTVERKTGNGSGN